MLIRFASAGDAPALLDIYRQYIDTRITFEYRLPTREEFAGRITEFTRVYPWLVAEEEGRALGYAYAHRMLAREAYGWIAELSVYLDGAAAGRGLGSGMYRALIGLLRLQNVHTVYGLVTLPNPASQRLHERMGFSLTGVLHGAGFKNGAWWDVGYYEKSIAPCQTPPVPLIPVSELPADRVEELLKADG